MEDDPRSGWLTALVVAGVCLFALAASGTTFWWLREDGRLPGLTPDERDQVSLAIYVATAGLAFCLGFLAGRLLHRSGAGIAALTLALTLAGLVGMTAGSETLDCHAGRDGIIRDWHC